MSKLTYTQSAAANQAQLPDLPRQDQDIFDDFLIMKIIEQKRVQQFGNRSGANTNALGFAQRKELVRNLGVRIDAVRLAELDAVTEFLGCNKQEFVMELLVAGLEQTKSVAAKNGLGLLLSETIDRKVEEAGFSVEPSANKGFWTLHYKGQPLEHGAEQAKQG
ncbi:MAG TPA: hypothetical protein VIL88_16560 [Devosia sp.]|jgi:hypothetical protein|uniref:hypothetical protein n=1 Tax=Devosia sp. TaxID=1871048 RepID=UPI002F925BD8